VKSTMMDVPLSLNHLLDRAGQLFAGNEIVSRLPDKSLRRHSFGEYYRRTRSLASALKQLGPARRVTGWPRCAGTTMPIWSATSAFRLRAG
jgi:acyl-CoA synthetase (AMP-forming)/AMP-acid ligase II